MTTVTLSLISHTNVGKTTLARTLLRREIGQVLDQAHVTETAEAHCLIEADGARLLLWDTPGFGDSRRLAARLRRRDDWLGWFLHQVWDRIADRPLYCSQRAIANVREHADVVLYLVNAGERPDEAGYVDPELEILGWLDRPIVLLLNQLDDQRESAERDWRALAERKPMIQDVLPLDAFTRCWTEEAVLFRRIAPLLNGPKRRAMELLASTWAGRNLDVFRRSCELLRGYIERAAADTETIVEETGARRGGLAGAVLDMAGSIKQGTVDRRRAMRALNERLDRSTKQLMDELIALHGLTGASAATIERRVQDFELGGTPLVDARGGAVAGAVISGALGGLFADVFSGGLTLGGGLIAGGILGALGGSALARGYRVLSGDGPPRTTWTTEFLDRLRHQVLLRYLAVAHFGRGRGEYRDVEQPAHWSEGLDRALAAGRRNAVDIEGVLRAVLLEAYPGAREILAQVGRDASDT